MEAVLVPSSPIKLKQLFKIKSANDDDDDNDGINKKHNQNQKSKTHVVWAIIRTAACRLTSANIRSKKTSEVWMRCSSLLWL